MNKPMNDGRWRIWCEPINGVEWCRLFGLEPHEVLKNIWAVRGPDGFKEVFASLPEAHTHAMRSSRTVEVELPEVKYAFTLSGIKPEITIYQDGVFSANGEVIMALHSTEYKAAGEYLIALHYAKERSLHEPG